VAFGWRGLIRGVASLGGDNLGVLYYLCASEICTDKRVGFGWRGGLWLEGSYKRGGLWLEGPYKRGGLWLEGPYKRGGLWLEGPYKRGGLWLEGLIRQVLL
jgi:hypothetical protein